MNHNKIALKSLSLGVSIAALTLGMNTAWAKSLSVQEAKEIARQAYIFGYPMVDNYRIQYSYFIDSSDSGYKGEMNEVHSVATVYTPKDTSIQTPNSDTPYSHIGADLRADALVLSVPEIEKNRYYSIQFVDMYTHNIDYVGSRTTGNEAAKFLLVGPNWKGKVPKGIKKVIRSETQLAFVQYRTQLFNPQDVENVRKIQQQYTVQTLSEFLGKPKKSAPKIQFLKALTREQQEASPLFFNQLNFLLQFAPVHPTEKKMRKSFEKIGVVAGKPFVFEQQSKNVQEGIIQGIQAAWGDLKARKVDLDTGKTSAADGFGTREFMQGRYVDRMLSAVYGIYGNTKEEALYPAYFVDSENQPLNGKNTYHLTFPAGQLPPVKSFWSFTMYTSPQMFLYDNKINRYLINSTMMDQLVKNPDGSITIFVQNEAPEKKYLANWLPAPKGDFAAIMRLYWPDPSALNGTWKEPKLVKVK